MSKLSVACGRSTLESEQCRLGVHQMRIAGTNCYLPTLPNNLYPATARWRGIVNDEAPGGHWVEARWCLATVMEQQSFERWIGVLEAKVLNEILDPGLRT